MSETRRLDVPLSANRRSKSRYGLDGIKQECTVRDEAGQQHNAHILDISAGGVGLLMDRRMDVGSYLSVVLPTREEAGSRTFTLRVRKSEQDTSGQWRIGCAFAHPIADDELLLLF